MFNFIHHNSSIWKKTEKYIYTKQIYLHLLHIFWSKIYRYYYVKLKVQLSNVYITGPYIGLKTVDFTKL